jgi:hypothetical protein
LDEIKAHPFFRGIDWDNIRLRPGPIVPHISGPLDTRYEEEGGVREREEGRGRRRRGGGEEEGRH